MTTMSTFDFQLLPQNSIIHFPVVSLYHFSLAYRSTTHGYHEFADLYVDFFFSFWKEWLDWWNGHQVASKRGL